MEVIDLLNKIANGEDARYNTEVKIVNKINEIIDYINRGEK